MGNEWCYNIEKTKCHLKRYDLKHGHAMTKVKELRVSIVIQKYYLEYYKIFNILKILFLH